MGNRIVGLKNIAFELNTSVNTVSRALRDCDDISEEMKKKVRKKALELGYISNSVSQFIKKDSQKSIVVVFNSYENHYFNIVCSKLWSLARKYKYDFSTICICKNKLDIATVKQCLSSRTDIIVSLINVDKEALDCCDLNKILLIEFGTSSNLNCDNLIVNDKMVGKLASNYLCNYHKCKKIVYIGINSLNSKEREESFIETTNKTDKNIEIKKINEKEVKTELLNLIEDGYFGIFCFNDVLVYQCLDYLNEAIPNFRRVYPKFHIIGVDALSLNVSGLVDITSIKLDYDRMCKEVFNILQDRDINPKLPKEKKLFPITLHQRKIV